MGKYDITSGMSEYKSQAFDPGLENFREISKMYRQTYDKNNEATNLMYKAVNQMDLAEGDEDLRELFRTDINSKLGNVLETGDYLNATSGVNDAYRYITTDMTLITAQKNAAERAKDKAFEEQYGASGVIDFNNGTGSTFKTLNEDGTLNKYDSKMEIRKNYDAKMQTLIGNIKSGNAGDIMMYGDINGDQVIDYLKYGTAQGVSQQKMERIVDGLLNNYLGSEEGGQDYRRLTTTGNGMTDLGAKQDIRRRFRAIGQSQVGITQNVQMKILPGGFGGSGGGTTQGAPGISNVAEAMAKREYFLGQDGLSTLLGSDKNADGSINYTTTEGAPLIFDLATTFSAEDKNTIIQQDLVQSAIANNGMTNDANTLLSAALVAQSMAKTGPTSEAQMYFYQQTGFRGRGPEFQALVTEIVQATRLTKQANMGNLLNNVSSFTGQFTPSGNAQIVGTSHITQPGVMRITERQLNTIASQTDLSDVSSFFGVSFGDDIDNIEDAQGNKIFKEIAPIEKGGETMYEFNMTTAPMNITGGGLGSNFERLDMTTADYTDNEASLKQQVATQAYIASETNDMLMNASNAGISNTEANVLSQLFITQPKLVSIYAQDKNAFMLRYENTLKNGKSTYDFTRSELGQDNQ